MRAFSRLSTYRVLLLTGLILITFAHACNY